MNFQNLNFDFVEAPRQGLPPPPQQQQQQQSQQAETFPSDSESTVLEHHRYHSHSQQYQQRLSYSESPYDSDFVPSAQSITPQFSHIPPAPSPPALSASTAEFYGPDRHMAFQKPRPTSFRFPREGATSATPSEPTVRFDESQLLMLATQNTNGISVPKDPLVVAAGKVTPGVDDTPYIQYAIQALTRRSRDEVSDDGFLSDGDFEDEMAGVEPPPSRRVLGEEMGHGSPPVKRPATSYAGFHETRRQSSSEEEPALEKPNNEFLVIRPTPPLTPLPHPPTIIVNKKPVTPKPTTPTTSQPAMVTPLAPSRRLPGGNQDWVPVTKEMRENNYPNDNSYPPLTYKPRILRPFSMMILMTLCLLMNAALIFSAVYSDRHNGLTQYPGTIYSGQYFLFRLLPQLLAAFVLVYCQAIVSTSLRVLPFAAMASEDARQRYLALFRHLYQVSFLVPRLDGPWQFRIFSVVTWLALFLIPLQSAAFTCIFVEGQWTWAPVQAVVWTLVALYSMITLATAILMVFWFGKWTGLMWDIRSLADLIPLLNRSNTTESYKSVGAGGPTRSEHAFKNQLHDRWFDRLGYWRKEDMQTGGIWYSIGTFGSPSGNEQQDPRVLQQIMAGKTGSRGGYRTSNDSSYRSSNAGSQQDLAVNTTCMADPRYDYLPVSLRDGPVAALVATTFVILLTLLIVSFLPQTRLDAGFDPLLSAKPNNAAFSAANFLYSFIPAVLGMIMFLLFQSLDLSLRIVQPWAELLKLDGAPARRSLLADYATCLPFQSSWRAARAGHWRVAVVSLVSVMFLAIPVLGGGLFMALTTPDGRVRMFPSLPVYGVLLGFLFLYLGSTCAILPLRRQFLLPRPVTSIADIVNFCCADELTQDSAFRSVRSRPDLEMRLGVEPGADAREESVWFFGVVPGKDEKTWSIRRMRRYTEKLSPTRRSMRSMV